MDILPVSHIRLIVHSTPQHLCERGSQFNNTYFIRINGQWGLKYFLDKNVRDHTYKLQKRAHRFGAAPRIGRKFCFTLSSDDDGEKYFGYITEAVVQTFDQKWLEDYPDCLEEDIPWPGDDEYCKLMDKLRQARITTYDLHGANVGWLSDGTLVVIDFGDERIRG